MKDLNDFMCICSPEGKTECEEMYRWALADLECGPEDFLNNVVYGLEWGLGKEKEQYSGDITIYCDQWAGISAKIYKLDRETGKFSDAIEAHVQCDKVEHGLARIWKWAKEGTT